MSKVDSSVDAAPRPSRLGEILLIRLWERGAAYTCNGDTEGCEGERFGGCVYCEDRKELHP